MEAAVKYLESRGKRVFGLLGHSKGGTNVILYASRHDGDGVRIVNVCGRCHLKTGISARFDEETLARLEREGSLQLPHPRTGAPYTLTREVRACFGHVDAQVKGRIGSAHRSADHPHGWWMSLMRWLISDDRTPCGSPCEPTVLCIQDLEERRTTDMIAAAQKIHHTQVLPWAVMTLACLHPLPPLPSGLPALPSLPHRRPRKHNTKV